MVTRNFDRDAYIFRPSFRGECKPRRLVRTASSARPGAQLSEMEMQFWGGGLPAVTLPVLQEQGMVEERAASGSGEQSSGGSGSSSSDSDGGDSDSGDRPGTGGDMRASAHVEYI